MSQLLTLDFWFTMRGEISPVLRFVFIGLIIVFTFLYLYLKYTKNSWKKSLMNKINIGILSFITINIFLALYLWFVFEEQVPMLSARIWLIIWLAEMFLWVMNIFKAYRKIPSLKENLEKKRKLKKYIP